MGAGQVGFNIAARLVGEGHDVTIVDRDEDRLAHATEVLDIQGLRGHGARPAVLEEAGVANADMIVAVTDLDEVNMIACQTAAILGPPAIIKIARVRDESYLDERIIGDPRMAIDLAINPERASADIILSLLRYREVTEVVEFAGGRVQLLGLQVRPTSPLAGLRITELRDRFEPVEVLIAAIHRDGEIIIPRGHDVILPRDEVYVVAEQDRIDIVLRAVGVSVAPVSRVMIAGGSKIGRYVAADLAARGLQPKVIDGDERHARWMSEELPNAVVLFGSPTDADLLVEENVGEMEAFIACGRDEEVNIMSALLAQRLGAKRVIVTTNRSDYPPLIKHIGVDVCISPRLVAVNSILHFIRRGRVVAARALGEEQAAEALEFEADLMSDLVGTPLCDLTLPHGALIASVIRDDTIIMPHGGTVIQEGDHVIMVALTTSLAKVERMIIRRVDLK